MFKIKGQRSKVKVTVSKIKVTAQSKVSKTMTARDRLTDFKLDTDVPVKAEDDCLGVGRPQVAMHRIYIFTIHMQLYWLLQRR